MTNIEVWQKLDGKHSMCKILISVLFCASYISQFVKCGEKRMHMYILQPQQGDMQDCGECVCVILAFALAKVKGKML